MHDVIERIEKLTEKIENGCWLFKGYLDKDGYGIVSGKWIIHRISAHVYLGLDLTDRNQQALHKLTCNNKNCWNPNHLYIGTAKDNALDRQQNPKTSLGRWGSAALNNSKTHCFNGHEYNEENTYIYTSPKTGRTQRNCRICNANNVAKKRKI